MKQRRSPILFFGVLCLCALGASASFIQNYTPPLAVPFDDPALPPIVGNSVLLPDGYAIKIQIADDGFATANDAYTVGDLRVPIDWASATGPQDQLSIFVTSDAAGAPDWGNVVGSFFTAPGTPVGNWDGDVTLSPITPFEMAEGVAYWIIAENGGDGTYEWGGETEVDSQILDMHTVRNRTLGLGGTDPRPALQLEVTSTVAVPEPAGLTLLMLVGVFGLTGRRRRTT